MGDTAGRLIEVKKNGVVTANYIYDSNGNRLAKVVGTDSTKGVYDEQDRLLQYGNDKFVYNKNGYLTAKITGTDTTKYTYDNIGNLQLVNLPTGEVIEYVVDANNRRITKKVNGNVVTKYLYQDQLKPVAELDSLGTVKRRYIYGVKQNVPEYYEQGGEKYRIITDHLGSVRLVIKESNGEVVTKIDYDEYGKEIYAVRDTSLSSMFFGYAGGLGDAETGLIRFGVRDYNPEVGRWTATDPIDFRGGDYNLYGYVLQEPINQVDFDGKTTGTTQNIFMVAVFNATAAATESLLRGNSIDKIGIDALIGGASSILGGFLSKPFGKLASGFVSGLASSIGSKLIEKGGSFRKMNNLNDQNDIASSGFIAALVAGLDGVYDSMRMDVKSRMIMSVVEGVITTIYKKKALLIQN